MFLQFIILILISYAIFLFSSSSTNPFAAIKIPVKRRRWRLGRAVGFGSLAAGSLSIFVFNFYSVDLIFALAMYLILFSLFTIPGLIKYRKTSVWG